MARAPRTNPDIRKEHILKAAITLAREVGYKNITRDTVAESAGISSSLIAAYFPTMDDLKNAVMTAAIDRNVFEIIAQGLVIGDKQANNLSKQMKRKVVDYIFK